MTQGSGRWPKPAGDASAPPLAPGAGSQLLVYDGEAGSVPGLEWDWCMLFAHGRCGIYVRLNFP